MSDEKPIPPAKPLKKKRTPLMLLLDVLIIALAVTGIALVARPKIIHWQQDHYSQQLLDNFEQGEGTAGAMWPSPGSRTCRHCRYVR